MSKKWEIASAIILALIGIGVSAGQGFQVNGFVLLFWAAAVIVFLVAFRHKEPAPIGQVLRGGIKPDRSTSPRITEIVAAVAASEWAKLNELERAELTRLAVAKRLPASSILGAIENKTPFAQHTFAGHFEINEQFAAWLEQQAALPSVKVFFDETDPNCHQAGGRVFVSNVGDGDVEHSETIYRLGVRSSTGPLAGIRLVLERSEPEPHDPGIQRIGLAMRPRIPAAAGAAEFTVNRAAPAYVDVLQEIVRRHNPMNESSRIRLIYVNEDRGRANWFENGALVLTFRLEGPTDPVRLRLAVEYDGRREHRRWRVREA